MKTNYKKMFGIVILSIIFCTVFVIVVESKALGYGEENDCLGQYVDDFENNNNFTVMDNTVVNTTLDCVELEYTLSGGGKAYENISENNFDESDPLDRIDDVTDYHLQFDSYRDEDARRYNTYGNAYFDEFIHEFDCLVDGAVTYAYGVIWMVTNTTEDLGYIYANNIPCMMIRCYRDASLNIIFQSYVYNGTSYGGMLYDIPSYDTWYYLRVIKNATHASFLVYSDSDRTNLVASMYVALAPNVTYNVLHVANERDQSGYHYLIDLEMKNYWIGNMLAGYADDGYCITTNCFDYCNGSSLVLLTNATLNNGTITVQFSNDNSTWVDHEGNAGSDSLIDGFYSLDLRDLNYTTLYRMYNFTKLTSTITPRLYQERVITTIGNCTVGGGTVTNVLFYPIILYGILGIFFICGIVVLSKHGRLRI